MSRDCRSGMKCTHCSGRHHSSICTRKDPLHRVSTSNHSQTPSLVKICRPLNRILQYRCVTSRTPVLLQTAKTVVYNPQEPQTKTEVRLISDNGSQRSYISNKVKDSLALNRKSVETMSVKTFGATEEVRQTYDVVMRGLATKGGAGLEIPLLVVPLICGPLFNQPTVCLRERFEHLSGLELADSSCDSDHLEVDILIGSHF